MAKAKAKAKSKDKVKGNEPEKPGAIDDDKELQKKREAETKKVEKWNILLEVAKSDSSLAMQLPTEMCAGKSFTIYAPDGAVPHHGGECSAIGILLSQARCNSAAFHVARAEGIEERVAKMNKDLGGTWKVQKKGISVGWGSNGGCTASWTLAKTAAGWP